MPAGDGRGLSPGDTTPGRVAPGRVFAGTSGFAYPDWAPRFYPAGLRGDGFLRHYATRLGACELNNTFYARPKPERIATWIAAVPDGFRFIVKGQRGATFRALFADPVDAIAWLTEPLPGFGSKLGGVLFRLDERTVRDDDRLSGLLRAWPPSIPLVVEAQHPSWHVDETFAALRDAGAVLCATDLDDLEEPPTIRRTGPFLYLRLRRSAYEDVELDAWAARVAPFVTDGLDAYVVFRHDADGTSALRAEGFPARVSALVGR